MPDSSAMKHYYRILLSYSDIKHATLCSRKLVSLNDEPLSLNGDDLIERALYGSMVVSYARPFNSSGKSEIGPIDRLSSDSLTFLSKEEMQLHKYMLLCRNKYIAHSDAEYLALSPFVANDLPNEMVVPEKNDGMAPFTLEYTKQVNSLCEKLLNWVVMERHKIEDNVKPFLPRRNYMPGES